MLVACRDELGESDYVQRMERNQELELGRNKLTITDKRVSCVTRGTASRCLAPSSTLTFRSLGLPSPLDRGSRGP
jgi:hypothetical protein